MSGKQGSVGDTNYITTDKNFSLPLGTEVAFIFNAKRRGLYNMPFDVGYRVGVVGRSAMRRDDHLSFKQKDMASKDFGTDKAKDEELGIQFFAGDLHTGTCFKLFLPFSLVYPGQLVRILQRRGSA